MSHAAKTHKEKRVPIAQKQGVFSQEAPLAKRAPHKRNGFFLAGLQALNTHLPQNPPPLKASARNQPVCGT